MPTLTPDIWGQIILQLGFGGLALFMLYKFGQRFISQSDAHISAMMKARDVDTAKAREERMETSERLTAVLSTQRAELMAALDGQRNAFTLALAERDVRTREMAESCHGTQDRANAAQERTSAALTRLADATVELRAGFTSLEQAVRERG